LNPNIAYVSQLVQSGTGFAPPESLVTPIAANIGVRVGGYRKKPVPVESASVFFDEKIKDLGDWRGKTLARVRGIIHQADPEIVEEWKWRGLPSGRTAASSVRERRTRTPSR
jgi:hypothetical protein